MASFGVAAIGLPTMLLNGINLGSIYALIAFGYVVVYRTNKILNFAHAPISALGALAVVSMTTDGGFGITALGGRNPLADTADHPVPFALLVLGGLGLAALFGAAVEALAMRPMRNRPIFSVTVVTIGVSITMQVLADQAPIARRIRVPWTVGTISVPHTALGIEAFIPVGVALGALGALIALNRTSFGLSARALACDEEAAIAQGVRQNRTISLTWALAAVLGAVAILMMIFAPRGYGIISSREAPGLFYRALAVCAIGGWDSYRGVYLAGLLIGVLRVLSGGLLGPHANLLGPGFSTVLPYVILVVVILTRPDGLFGTKAASRV